MLTQEEILENKTKFIGLLSELNIDITNLFKYLEAVDYFNQPLTSTGQGAYAGGLCKYALASFRELSQLILAYCPNLYTKEDAIKVALLKDIFRAELYEPYIANVKNDQTGAWESVQAYRTKKEHPSFGDIGFSSYMIAKHFVPLTDDQIEAICLAPIKSLNGPDIHDVLRSYKLSTLTIMAEMAVRYISNWE